MLNLFRGGKVTSSLSALRSEDRNCKGGDAAGSDSRMYPGESVVGKAATGSGCSSAGKTSSSGGIYSGYTGSGT
uniref:Uncharacterized protein n=1 Tax=Tanacetum cinerariifolium TaxID=118510 RepID=A0A699VFC5_TANCI|nr:hypothetical protein [Tanacetum cinerariifolium]